MAFNGISFRIPPNAIFFNSKVVMDATTKAERRVMFKFGMETRKDAKSSMRKRRQPSQPGQPPRVVHGMLKRFLFFGYEPQKHSVVIGPALLTGFEGAGEAPEALEYGTDNDVAARPFMNPAFRRQLNLNMPGMWKNSIR